MMHIGKKLGKMFSATLFSCFITSILSAIGFNKLPEVFITKLKETPNYRIPFLGKILYENMGITQRDPMGFLLFEFIFILFAMSILFIILYSDQWQTTENLNHVKKEKTLSKDKYSKYLLVFSTIAFMVYFGIDFQIQNLKYNLSIVLERQIEIVAPLITDQEYKVFRSAFRSVNSEEDYLLLYHTLEHIADDAEKNGMGVSFPYLEMFEP